MASGDYISIFVFCLQLDNTLAKHNKLLVAQNKILSSIQNLLKNDLNLDAKRLTLQPAFILQSSVPSFAQLLDKHRRIKIDITLCKINCTVKLENCHVMHPRWHFDALICNGDAHRTS